MGTDGGTQPAEAGWDFFVSYTDEDRGWAEWVAWQLEDAGYRVLLQAWDMVAGSNWAVRMQEGTASADRTIALLSAAYLTSVYRQAEWQAAQAADPLGFGRKLVPIRVADCPRPGLLGQIVSFDLFGLDQEHARDLLLEQLGAVRVGRAKPGIPPNFPGHLSTHLGSEGGRQATHRSSELPPRPPSQLLPGDSHFSDRETGTRVENRFDGTSQVVIQAGAIHGDLHFGLTRAIPVPQQLPAAPSLFVGREHARTILSRTLGEPMGTRTAPAMVVIAGVGGVGKTACALRWAHDHRQLFPDGQLYADLRGFDPTGRPTDPVAVVRGLLDAFGMGANEVPVDPESQFALYRSLVAGRQILIVLDNARDSGQVRPLLPGTPTSSVLITSRSILGGLLVDGMKLLGLDALPAADADELLKRLMGSDRVAAEPSAAAELSDYCAGLPLAIRIVGSRAASRSNISLALLAAELREASSRLDELDGGDTRVRLAAVFSWSYEALSADAARLFRLLGAATGPDISIAAAAALTGSETRRTRSLLRELADVHLVQEHQPGRFRMHDLLRLYTVETGRAREFADDILAGRRRMAEYFLHTAYRGDRLVKPSRWEIELDRPEPGFTPSELTDEAAALQWFDDEYNCLLAVYQDTVAQGWDRLAWQLAWALNSYQHRRAYIHQNIAVWQAALNTAVRLADLVWQTTAYRRLGYALLRAGAIQDAVDHLQHGLDLANRSGEIPGLAHTHHAMVWVLATAGDLETALVHAEKAISFYAKAPSPVWEADLLNAIGSVHIRLGRLEQARAFCERSLVIFRASGHAEGEATVLDGLASIAAKQGHVDNAIDLFTSSVAILERSGSSFMMAEVLSRLAGAYETAGRIPEAREALLISSRIYRSQHLDKAAATVEKRLAALSAGIGDIAPS